MSNIKLNFGCGNRFSEGWVNIDFHSEDKRVRRVNLLSGFPFRESSFDVVYSNQVLEHFDRIQGEFLLKECYRVLRKGGVLRIVVPDLEGSCREYLRVLSLPDGPEKKKLYDWIIVELLDQMVRNEPAGEMGRLVRSVMAGEDEEFKQYIIHRTENWLRPRPSPPPTLANKVKKITLQKLQTKFIYWYLRAVSLLIPSQLRDMVMVRAAIGERHRWMYDAYALERAFKKLGFRNVRRVSYDESSIPNFNEDYLDRDPDGKPYKYNSIHMEGIK